MCLSLLVVVCCLCDIVCCVWARACCVLFGVYCLLAVVGCSMFSVLLFSVWRVGCCLLLVCVAC